MAYIVTDYKVSGKGRVEICLDGKETLWLYAKEARQLSLEEGMELPEGQYRHILHEVIGRRAVERAMHLLERQERTEHQLREKLAQSGYPGEAIEDAVAYVRRYHYLDDARYARTFIRYHQEKSSRQRLEQDLLRRGVPRDIITQSMEEEYSSDEKAKIHRLLEKKHFVPGTADQSEMRKIYGFLMRRGFRSADIASVLRAGWEE